MKKIKPIVTISIISFIAISMFLLQKYTSNSNTVTLKENLYKKDTHLPSQRTWQIKTLTRIPLDSEIQDSLLNSMILKSFDNILYVVDYADMKIKRFSSTGRFIDKFGKNIGRGPSDFLQILDFSVYGNTLTAIDKTYTAKKFLLNSENSHKTVKLKNFTYRVVSSKDEFITLGFTQELFKTYGVNDSIKVSFGELSDMQFANIFGFGGYLTLGREDDIFIYAPRFASYLIFYSVDGRYIKSIQTIDRMEFQKPIRNEYGIRVPDSHISTSGIAVNKVHIFIEYLRKEIKNSDNEKFRTKHSIIDIYSRDSYRYITSISTPQRTSGITVVGDTLYTINNYNRKIEAFLLPEIE